MATLLRDEGQADRLVTFLEEWMATEPETQTVYDQYLSALLLAKRSEQADALALQWLQQSQVAGPLPGDVLSKLEAAIRYATGRIYQMHRYTIDCEWFAPLAQTARFFLESPHHNDVSVQIIQQSSFSNSLAAERLLGEIHRHLQDDIEQLDAEFTQRFVGWTLRLEAVSDADWQRVVDALRSRWEVASDLERSHLATAIEMIERQRFGTSRLLAFLRTRIERADRELRHRDAANLRERLFSLLLAQPWELAIEREAAALLDSLGDTTSPWARVSIQVADLILFVDSMLERRLQHDLRQIHQRPTAPELTRNEYAKKIEAARQAALAGVAETLAMHSEGDGELAAWVRIEKMDLDVKRGHSIESVIASCWQLLGDKPDGGTLDVNVDGVADEAEAAAAYGRVHRRRRALAIITYLAGRANATPELVERLSRYLEAGAQLDGDVAESWRKRQHDWLIVLDQPELLQQKLREWIEADPLPSAWQLVAARLAAEVGQLEQAIALLNAASSSIRLRPADWAMLADWYLVMDQRSAYERTRVKRFAQMQDGELYARLQWRLNQQNNASDLRTTELDEEVLFAIQALFAKTNQPENYLHFLQSFYEASRDFRLLQELPTIVLGRTEQEIYQVLVALQNHVLSSIEKEATADTILRSLKAAREANRSPVDRRALDLLEVLVARQAATLLEQPEPHVERAIAALQRAFKDEWADGEVRRMTTFLQMLQGAQPRALTAERIRLLKRLRDATSPGSDDRLRIDWQIARSYAWENKDQQAGLEWWENALRAYSAAHPDGLPRSANGFAFEYVSMLETVHRFVDAETFLANAEEASSDASQQRAFAHRRLATCIRALKFDGQVSLGTGKALYANLLAALEEQRAVADRDADRLAIARQYCALFKAAADKGYLRLGPDVRAFADQTVPDLLAKQTLHVEEILREVSGMLLQVSGKAVAFAWLVERQNDSPPSLEYSNRGVWQQHGSKLASWREELGELPEETAAKFLDLVLKQLERDLAGGLSANRYAYGNAGWFWTAKAERFAEVAESVHEMYRDDRRVVARVARYFADDLRRPERAAEIMLAAYRESVLATEQQNDLIEYLHETEQYEVSIPILQSLVIRRPNDLRHRTELLTAYHQTDREAAFQTLLAETDQHFRQADRWTEGMIAGLATACLKNKAFAAAAGYFQQAIAMHKRTPQNAQQSNLYLSRYYADRADALAAVGDTWQAVDSASAAIVVWSREAHQRRDFENRLRGVLDVSKDLDAFIERWNQQVAEVGQDNPLLRQQLGFLLAERGQPELAIIQLRAALELQPFDIVTHEKLIEVLDMTGRQEAATKQLLVLIDFERHNLDRYRQLAMRLADDPEWAERAVTTIVEAAPNEAEHHQALAEIRESNDRWTDAIKHWQRVAEIRSLEPTGWLRLAQAQLHEGQHAEARQTLRKLRQTDWPARFGDLAYELQRLERALH